MQASPSLLDTEGVEAETGMGRYNGKFICSHMIQKLPVINLSENAGLTKPTKDFYSKLIEDKTETEKLHTLKFLLP